MNEKIENLIDGLKKECVKQEFPIIISTKEQTIILGTEEDMVTIREEIDTSLKQFAMQAFLEELFANV